VPISHSGAGAAGSAPPSWQAQALPEVAAGPPSGGATLPESSTPASPGAAHPLSKQPAAQVVLAPGEQPPWLSHVEDAVATPPAHVAAPHTVALSG
jgi:hypothetical protein